MSGDLVVTLHVWRLQQRHALTALPRVLQLRTAARGAPGVEFAKVLGTADARFTPRGASPTRWALLTVAPRGAVESVARSLGWWERTADERARLVMAPLRTRGRWSGHDPFRRCRPDAWTGPVVALTRSRLRLARAARFYRSVPPVAADLNGAPGLRAAFGIGEAPLIWQGTVSIWDDQASMRRFAVGSAHHAAAVRATPAIGWYAEELFARLALLEATGTVDGRRVG